MLSWTAAAGIRDSLAVFSRRRPEKSSEISVE
jgi:hypothetical protein